MIAPVLEQEGLLVWQRKLRFSSDQEELSLSDYDCDHYSDDYSDCGNDCYDYCVCGATHL